MVRFSILRRTVFGEKPPVKVENRLTPFRHRFKGILEEVRRLHDYLDQNKVSEFGKIHKIGKAQPVPIKGLKIRKMNMKDVDR